VRRFRSITVAVLISAPLAPQIAPQIQKSGGGPARLAPDPRLWNTGLAVRFGTSGSAGGVLAYVVDESDQSRDLNGDGDLTDRVLHLVDPGARRVLGTARALFPLEHLARPAFGNAFALAVSEAGQGADLDGDGDQVDPVLSVVDARTGLVRDLGIEVESFFGAAGVLSVRSPFGGYDQKGRLSVYDSVQDRLVTLGRIGDGRVTPGGEIVLFVDETFSSLDLNGDGDRNDTVVNLYDFERDALTNTGLAVRLSSGSDPVAVQRRTLLVPVHESSQRRDLNGDGDLSDEILHEFDLDNHALRNAGLDGHALVPDHALDRGPEAALYFIVAESTAGLDLNGDGDTRDRRWAYRRASGESAYFPGLLGDFSHFDAKYFGERFVAGFANPSTRILDVETGAAEDTKLPTYIDLPIFASPNLVVSSQSEELRDRDLDGDGVLASQILVVQDIQRRTIETRNRPVEVDFAFGFFPRVGLDGSVAAFASPELPGRDGNGDGDESDSTVVIYDANLVRGGKPLWIDTGVSCRQRRPGEFLTFPRVGGPWVVWLVLESDESKDLDHDGALDDEVLAAFHVPGRRLLLFAGAQLNTLEDGRLFLALQETVHGDLDGDGDALDSVLHLVLPP
jgi:hypothetical protein